MTRVLFATGLVAYALLSVFDLMLTSLLLQFGGGSVYEGNPIARGWLEYFGWPGLVTFKILSSGLVAGVSVFISLYRPRLGLAIIALACMVMVGVVLFSVGLLDKLSA
jgi:hypothetical protein